MLKVKMLETVSGDTELTVGKSYDLPVPKAIALIDAGIAKPTNKQAYTDAVKAKEAAVQTQLEREKKAAAILYRDELLSEKENLLNRVGEINADLEIEDVIIKKEDHQNLLDMAESVEVSKDEFLTLVGEAETITVPKLEHEKLVEAQTPKEDKKEGEE